MCWGRNHVGQLGASVSAGVNLGTLAVDMTNLTPIMFATSVTDNGNSVVQVTTGSYFTCALFTKGGIICWGSGQYGALGTDSTGSVGSGGTVNTLSFIRFSDTLPAITMTSGPIHTCAVFSNQRVRCWGSNAAQQIGDTTTFDRGSGTGTASVSSAVFVTFSATINSIAIVDIATGVYHKLKGKKLKKKITFFLSYFYFHASLNISMHVLFLG
jgi:alpha-tubulin suppressor-like RCC1 family protein